MNTSVDRQDRSVWPYPSDTPLQRARRIALAYRQHLKVANPGGCRGLDEMARAFGEGWVCEQVVTTASDEMLTTAEAAELAGVDPETIHKWRRRGYLDDHDHRRRLATSGLNERGWPMFRAADVLEVAATTRRRRLRRLSA